MSEALQAPLPPAPSAIPARQHPPVLLSMAHWYGTLAAVREIGRRGVEVQVASPSPFRQAAWSRYARRLAAPDERDANGFLRWLLDHGDRNPGLALCATSDDLCFLLAAHQRELRKKFFLHTPGLEVLRQLLDKKLLHQHAEAAGLRTPATLFPADADEAVALAARARWPLLIKQRTQVLSRTLDKGMPVTTAPRLRGSYRAFRRRNRFDPEVLARWPGVDRPMLQEYLPRSSGRIYCLSGFVAAGRSVTRAARKVLSHPRYLGIGLLFEGAEVIPRLEDGVLRLCRSVGYEGIFQCEFLEHDGQHLLIDFNPRFYNYMALDHARGLSQAWLAYLAAAGAREELVEEIERARAVRPGARRTLYCYRLGTWTQLRLERLLGRIPSDEPARWQRWLSGAAAVVDPAWASDDARPGLADALSQLWRLARHPRSFLRANTRQAL
jgi:D-aspartate ligase